MIATPASLAFAAALVLAAPSTVLAPAPVGAVVPVQSSGAAALEAEIDRELPVCAATAVDDATGALGNGDGATREEARARALAECRKAGGTNCVVTSAECDPSRTAD